MIHLAMVLRVCSRDLRLLLQRLRCWVLILAHSDTLHCRILVMSFRSSSFSRTSFFFFSFENVAVCVVAWPAICICMEILIRLALSPATKAVEPVLAAVLVGHASRTHA